MADVVGVCGDRDSWVCGGVVMGIQIRQVGTKASVFIPHAPARAENASLDQLAHWANTGYRDAVAASSTAGAYLGAALYHALWVGECLIEAKSRPEIKHGEWLPWLKENFEGSRRTAADYMRLAGARKEVEGANEQHAAHFSIRQALRIITAPVERELNRRDLYQRPAA
jgi:hypothetical protein